MIKKKEFTPKQLERLPDMGYVVGNDVECIMNGKCKYIRTIGWCTLLWSCCTTRKQLSNDISIKWFATWEEVVQNHPQYRTFGKAPNDF